MLKIDEKLKEVKELKRKLNQFKKNTRGKSMTSKEK
jgi:hypothetical protein